jgi:ribosomal protein S18 acetylase RimI-like enzyme
MTRSGVVIRELTAADLPAVVELCRSALDLPADAAEAPAIVSRLWAPDARRTVGSVAVGPAGGGDPASGDPASGGPASGGPAGSGPAALLGVAMASLGPRPPGEPPPGHVDLLAVRPAARRRGIGRALLDAVATALAGHGAAEVLLAGNPPNYAWPGIDVRYTPAVCAAAALGYEHDRTVWNMTADLSPGSAAVRDTGSAEVRLTAAGVRVRRATAADLDALVALAREHFAPSWADELTDSVDRPGAGCHLALRGGGLLGFAAYGSSRPSWFGPMGTTPAARGLGIGEVLLRRCLIDMRAAGLASAEIGWVGPVPFYSAATGARIERVFFLFRKRL